MDESVGKSQLPTPLCPTWNEDAKWRDAAAVLRAQGEMSYAKSDGAKNIRSQHGAPEQPASELASLEK